MAVSLLILHPALTSANNTERGYETHTQRLEECIDPVIGGLV